MRRVPGYTGHVPGRKIESSGIGMTYGNATSGLLNSGPDVNPVSCRMNHAHAHQPICLEHLHTGRNPVLGEFAGKEGRVLCWVSFSTCVRVFVCSCVRVFVCSCGSVASANVFDWRRCVHNPDNRPTSPCQPTLQTSDRLQTSLLDPTSVQGMIQHKRIRPRLRRSWREGQGICSTTNVKRRRFQVGEMKAHTVRHRLPSCCVGALARLCVVCEPGSHAILDFAPIYRVA